MIEHRTDHLGRVHPIETATVGRSVEFAANCAALVVLLVATFGLVLLAALAMGAA